VFKGSSYVCCSQTRQDIYGIHLAKMECLGPRTHLGVKSSMYGANMHAHFPSRSPMHPLWLSSVIVRGFQISSAPTHQMQTSSLRSVPSCSTLGGRDWLLSQRKKSSFLMYGIFDVKWKYPDVCYGYLHVVDSILLLHAYTICNTILFAYGAGMLTLHYVVYALYGSKLVGEFFCTKAYPCIALWVDYGCRVVSVFL